MLQNVFSLIFTYPYGKKYLFLTCFPTKIYLNSRETVPKKTKKRKTCCKGKTQH